MDLKQYQKCTYKGQIEEAVRTAIRLRSSDKPLDVSFADIVQGKFNVTLDTFMHELGINPNQDTIHNLVTLPDMDVRWIIPEIYREALLLGYREAPIWPSIIAAEEGTTGLTQMVPYLNMSDAAPAKVNEAETIPLGTISYGGKTFTIFKVGRGISISYEVMQYASLNVVSLFLRDFGVKLGQAFDTLAIDCLINGDQPNGSESAPVIGVKTPGSKAYRDFLKIWIRLSRLGRSANTIIGGEDAAIDTLDLDEFKKREAGTTQANLTIKTPIPRDASYFIHGNVPDHQEIILDPRKSLIKLNAQPLMVESEKIVSNQTHAFYATLTSGFARMFRDSSLILDSSLDFSTNGFPSYMDVDPLQFVEIK